MNMIRIDFGIDNYQFNKDEYTELVRYLSDKEFEPFFAGTFKSIGGLLPLNNNNYLIVFNKNKNELLSEIDFITSKLGRYLIVGECDDMLSYDEFINNKTDIEKLVISFKTYDDTRPGILITKNNNYDETREFIDILSTFFSNPSAYLLRPEDVHNILLPKVRKFKGVFVFNNIFYDCGIKPHLVDDFNPIKKHRIEEITI